MMESRAIPVMLSVMSFGLLFHPRGSCEETPKPPRKLQDWEVYLKVPEIVQRDLYEKALKLALMVYKDADNEEIREVCRSSFLKDFQIVGPMKGIEPPVVGGGESPWVRTSFPWPDEVSVGTEQVPRGLAFKSRDEPISLNEAKDVSYSILSRLCKDANEAKDFKLKYSIETQDRTFWIVWNRNIPGDLVGAVRSVVFLIRKPDGLVTRVSRFAQIRKPKISFAEISGVARKSGLNSWLSDITLESRNLGGRLRLVWRYETPPSEGGSGPNDTTFWDANTGELLCSMVLHGGTPEKPYGAETIYKEAKQEDYIPNLQEQIRLRVKELEEEQAAKSKK